MIARLPSPRLLARTTTSVFLLQITWEPGKTHPSAIAVGNPQRAISDIEQIPGTQMVGRQCLKRKLPSVTIVGNAERSNASGGVRLVSGWLPEARFRLTYFTNRPVGPHPSHFRWRCYHESGKQ